MDRANIFFLMTMVGASVACTSSEEEPPRTGTGDATTGVADGSSDAAGESETEGPADGPGTGDGTSGGRGTAAEDATSGDAGDGPTDETGSDGTSAGGDPSGCEAFYATYDACVPEYAGEGDCSYLLDSLPDIDGCAPATDSYYECLSQLDCQTLETLDGFPCRDEYQAAFDSCDGAGGACQSGVGSGDLAFTTCDTTLFNCLDDNEYTIECTTNEAADAVDCTCAVNGVVDGTLTLATAEAICGGEEVAAAVVSECGWPQAVADGIL